MIGTVSYINPSRKFALVTLSGRTRASDIFVAEVWFWVAGIELPAVGQLIEFDVSADTNGYIEAVQVRNPGLPSCDGLATDGPGAAPATAFLRAVAGKDAAGGC